MIAVAAANGGYFATAFGWTALAFAWVTIIAVVLVAPRWTAFDVTWLVGAGALCVFTFSSAVWAGSAGTAVDQGQRAVVYTTAVAGALLVLRRRDLERWLAGLVLGAAAICFYSLATRLFADHFGGFNSPTIACSFRSVTGTRSGSSPGSPLLLALRSGRSGTDPRAARPGRCRTGRAAADAVLHLQPWGVGALLAGLRRRCSLQPLA